MIRWRLAGFVFLLVATGCSDPASPLPLPEGAVQFIPGPEYRGWWSEVEACSGLRGDFDEVTWFVVPGEEPFRVKGFDRPVAGYWDGAAKRIVLLEWVPSASHLARHEILHALLRRPGHPREYFVDKCGDLVIGPGVPLTID